MTGASTPLSKSLRRGGTLIAYVTHAHELPHKSLPMPDLSESRGALLAAACRTINAARAAPAAPVTRLRPRCIYMELLACCAAFTGSCWQRRRTRLFSGITSFANAHASRRPSAIPLVLRSGMQWWRSISSLVAPISMLHSACALNQRFFMRRWQSQASRLCCQRHLRLVCRKSTTYGNGCI